MHDSMVMFAFFIFEWSCSFRANNLVLKIKIVILSWNLLPRLIRMCRIQWDVQFLCFQPEVFFWANSVQKIKIISLSWNFVFGLIWIWRIQWWCSFFCFPLFWEVLNKKIYFRFWCYLINLPAIYAQRLEAILFHSENVLHSRNVILNKKLQHQNKYNYTRQYFY